MAKVLQSVKKFLTGRLWFFIGWDLVLFVLISLLFTLLSPDPVKINAPIIKPDSLGLCPAIAALHNTVLISILTQREATDLQVTASSIDVLWQTRSTYVLILAALVTLVFTQKEKVTPRVAPKVLYIIILVVILSMYYLDVHTGDLVTRERKGSEVTTKELVKLTSLSPTDTTRYMLSFDSIVAQYVEAQQGSFKRKVSLALHPSDIERGVFHVLPLVGLYVAATWRHRKSSPQKEDVHDGNKT